MEVSATKTLTDLESEKLCGIFRCGNNELLARKLRPFAQAALTEYMDMLLNPKGRKDQLLKDRLFLVIQESGELPDETEIKEWTGLDIRKTRLLIKDVLIAKKHEIGPLIDQAACNLLDQAENINGSWYITTTQSALIEFLNDEISRRNPGSDEISKIRGARNKYKMSNNEYEILADMATS